MRLQELDLTEMTWEEFVIGEMEILDELPRTREGAEEIIDYLLGMDSVNAWVTLLSEYEEVLTEEEYKDLALKAVVYIDANYLELELDEE